MLPSKEDLLKKKNQELKDMLGELGLPTSGNKTHLVERLLNTAAAGEGEAGEGGDAEEEVHVEEYGSGGEGSGDAGDDAGGDEEDEDADEDEDGVEQLPGDSVCGFDSALDVWLTSIEFQAACHKKGVDDFDPVQREAYAAEGQKCATAWVNAVQKHSKYKASWQYLHDALAHFYEDVMEHGMVEWTDDSILEKGNRKQKALKRLIFHTRWSMRRPLRSDAR